YKLALAEYRDGAIGPAIAEARRAVVADAQLADAYYLLALCLREQNKRDEAVAMLQQALERAPALVPAREELADIFAESGREADRLQQLEALAALDPGHSERRIAVALAQ